MSNNQVTVAGRISKPFTYSHEAYGETFYISEVEVWRLSNQIDKIPILISEKLIDPNQDCTSFMAIIDGQYRSYNIHDEDKNRLKLSLFVSGIEFVDEIPDDLNPNSIYLDGFVCKEPVYRQTPLGREITDLLIAVNRPYGKSDYIPCIAWGRNARFASYLPVGSNVKIYGRIQSRVYTKHISETETEEHVAYEVSITSIE